MNVNVDSVEKCLSEVNQIIFNFLEEQGGYSNGYLTFVSGKIDHVLPMPSDFSWNTPRGNTDLTEVGRKRLAKELYSALQEVLKKHEVDSVVVRSKDEDFGVMRVEVAYVRELKQSIPLFKLK